MTEFAEKIHEEKHVNTVVRLSYAVGMLHSLSIPSVKGYWYESMAVAAFTEREMAAFTTSKKGLQDQIDVLAVLSSEKGEPRAFQGDYEELTAGVNDAHLYGSGAFKDVYAGTAFKLTPVVKKNECVKKKSKLGAVQECLYKLKALTPLTPLGDVAVALCSGREGVCEDEAEINAAAASRFAENGDPAPNVLRMLASAPTSKKANTMIFEAARGGDLSNIGRYDSNHPKPSMHFLRQLYRQVRILEQIVARPWGGHAAEGCPCGPADRCPLVRRDCKLSCAPARDADPAPRRCSWEQSPCTTPSLPRGTSRMITSFSSSP